MRIPSIPLRITLVSLAVTALAISAPALAQATSNSDRLFNSFIEDAVIVDNQWWEGRLEYQDPEFADITVLNGLAAFRPWKRIEVGARVGFGDSDVENSTLDGSGATDLDGWVKYFFGASEEGTEFAVGSVVTLPTGDDSAFLGADAFALSAFGTLRRQFNRVILSAHAGVQFNEDGQIGLVELEGETAPLGGVAVIWPTSDRLSLVGEATLRGERFEGQDSDVRILAGVNWRRFKRGILRGAVAFGLDDGAPDLQVIAGYAANF
ncbi:MAG: hypothetical protein GY716_19450 [bacterium]|nr:hypothetical protein [bacterium]